MGADINQAEENRVLYILHKIRRSLNSSELTLFINKKNVCEGLLFLEKVQKTMKMEYFMVNLMR
jgi:hypothetical protein